MPKSALKKTVRISGRIGKKSLFKKASRRINSYSPVRLGATVLIILVFLILIGKVLGLVNNLTHPYSPDLIQNSSKFYNYDGNGIFNLAIKLNDVYVLSYNPSEKSTLIFRIPPDTYVNVPFGFGSWPIRSVYDLGQGGKVTNGARLLKETISNVFGVQVDRVMIVSGQLADKRLDEVLEKIRQNPFESVNLINNSKTDLSGLEYLKLWWDFRGVRADHMKVVDLGQSDLTSWDILGDGSRVLQLNRSMVDQFIQKQFEDTKMKNEELTVGIFNGTNHPGLAESAARLITNMGGRVVFTTNLGEHIETSQVFASPEKKSSYTAMRLSQIFASPFCDDKKRALSCRGGQNPELLSESAEINVILGEDYFILHSK